MDLKQSHIQFDFHSASSDEDIKKNYPWRNHSLWMTHDFRTLTHWFGEQFYILLHRVWGDIFCSFSCHFWFTQTQCLNLKQDPLLQKKLIIILFFYVLFAGFFSIMQSSCLRFKCMSFLPILLNQIIFSNYHHLWSILLF